MFRSSLSRLSQLKFPKHLSALQMSQPMTTAETSSKSPRGADWLMSYFPEILRETTEHVQKYSNPETAQRFSQALQYTIKGGKRIRGLTATRTFEAFVDPEKLTPENIKLAGVLGLAMEMWQAWGLALDDIVDGSTTRRGQPSWYLTEGVGMGAINDIVLISKAQYHILKKYFGHLTCYPMLIEKLNLGEFITMCGQTADFLCSKKSVREFNLDLYRSIAANKAFYAFNIPVSLGMVLAHVHQPQQVEMDIHCILQEIGTYFQIQDDVLDCFGASEATGKVGNDIQEGKCTWLAATFMDTASDVQKKEFVRLYGCSEPEKVLRVKELYKEIGLPATYKAFEDNTVHILRESIDLLPEDVPKDLFNGLINDIHKRTG